MKHPSLSIEPTPFATPPVDPGKADIRSNRLKDIADLACCAAFVVASVAMLGWLWWSVISLPSPR